LFGPSIIGKRDISGETNANQIIIIMWDLTLLSTDTVLYS